MDTAAEVILDLIGIGIGPFNLSLAALAKPVASINSLFFDRNPGFDWHRGMLLEGSRLQVPFFADLVTMVDPRSEFTFVNYLHVHDRLHRFCAMEDFKIFRAEYNRYCQWVSSRLDNLRFSSEVAAVERDGSMFVVSVRDLGSGEVRTYRARNIVMGVGTVPRMPVAAYSADHGGACLHSSDYLYRRAEILSNVEGSVVVIGGGQSAAEIFLDLLENRPGSQFQINWLSQSRAFSAMEYSRLGVEHFTPSYVDYFYALEARRKTETLAGQKHWYKGISIDTINQIYECLYRKSVDQDADVVIQANSRLFDVRRQEGMLRLGFEHTDLGTRFEVPARHAILATGYRYEFPAALASVRDLFRFDTQGRPCIEKDYALVPCAAMLGRIFVQNMEIHSHGASAPDLGVGAFRAATILNSIVEYDLYRVDKRKVFQTFGISDRYSTALPCGVQLAAQAIETMAAMALEPV